MLKRGSWFAGMLGQSEIKSLVEYSDGLGPSRAVPAGAKYVLGVAAAGIFPRTGRGTKKQFAAAAMEPVDVVDAEYRIKFKT